MDPITLMIICGAGAVGFYMAWSIGANDVANAMATSVGSKALTFKQAVIIAATLSVLGAVFVGSEVADTVKGKIILERIATTADPAIMILGFFAALLAAAIWVTLSTWKEMPISTTHSIIGALVGFGLIQWGAYSVNWTQLGFVASSWVLSPVFGCIVAFFVFKIIVKLIFAKEEPVHSAKIVGPFIIGSTTFLITLALLLKTPLSDKLGIDCNYPIIFSIASIVLVFVSIISLFLLRKIEAKNLEDYKTVESIFGKLQIITACYMAFSHGANDVANAIGPVAGIIGFAGGTVGMQANVQIELLAIGGLGIAIGCMTWGRRVMRTVGGKITNLNHTRGFSVEFAAATTVLTASKLGMPVSTSHTVVGAVIGVGLARGLDAIDTNVIKKIVTSWLLTVPVAAFTAAVIFIILRAAFL